jgi:hypothetical protein
LDSSDITEHRLRHERRYTSDSQSDTARLVTTSNQSPSALLNARRVRDFFVVPKGK